MRESTQIQHGVALKRAAPLDGLRVTAITTGDLDRLVADLHTAGKARATIRRTLVVVAMVLDHAGVEPNPARDKRVRLPVEEREELRPPTADHIEAVARLLTPQYRLGLYVLDATGCRVGELEQATVGDLDEHRQGWVVRSAVSKTRQSLLVGLPDDLWLAVTTACLRGRIATTA